MGAKKPMTGASVLFTCENGVARPVLNRPGSGNALDVPTRRALMDAAIGCYEEQCVVLEGAGRNFLC
jgi:enoyl-CoA hydratase/carnithine racemase